MEKDANHKTDNKLNGKAANKRLPASIRGLLLIAGAVLGFWVLSNRNGKAERICELDSSERLLEVANDSVFLFRAPIKGEKEVEKIALSLERKRTTYWTTTANFEFQARTPNLLLTSDGVIYPTLERQLPSPNPDNQFSSSGSPRQFRTVNKRLALQDMGGIIPECKTRHDCAIRLQQLGSSVSTTLLPGIHSNRSTLRGNFAQAAGEVYWIHDLVWPDTPRFKNRVENDVLYTYQLPPCNRLMVTNPKTGVTASTGVVVGSRSAIYSWSGGVLWLEYLDDSGYPSLGLLRSGSRKPSYIREYGSMNPPLEMSGRFYWDEPVWPKKITDGPATRMVVKSATMDLKDIRTVSELPATPQQAFQPILYLADNRMVAVFRGPKVSGVPDAPSGLVVFEIDVNGKTPPRKLCDLPGVVEFKIDGDYCYYLLRETQDRWWDWSKSGLENHEVNVLFRKALFH
jgi:hypothetical protein